MGRELILNVEKNSTYLQQSPRDEGHVQHDRTNGQICVYALPRHGLLIVI